MIKKRWKVITNLSQPQRLDQPIVKSIKRTKAQYHFPRSTKERLLQGLIKTRRAICIILSPEGPPPPLLLKIQVTQANRQIDLSLKRFEFLPIGIYYMMISLSYTKNFEMAIFCVNDSAFFTLCCFPDAQDRIVTYPCDKEHNGK